MGCVSPLKGFKSKSTGGIVFKRSADAGAPMEVACGQCITCRVDRSQEWAMRIMHEATQHERAYFLTLTYREAHDCTEEQFRKGHHVPADGSLNKSHFQKFMKRYRRFLADEKVRYYHCGEYGNELDRPHYHACIFGHDFGDKILLKEDNERSLFISEKLQHLWPYGFHSIGSLTFQSAAYVARYCMKKVTGELANDHYLRCDADGVAYWLQPEYVSMSRRPGIGREWYEKYHGDVFPADETPIPGKGVTKKVPRYYEELYKAREPEGHAKIKRQRQRFLSEHKEEFTGSRLMAKYRVALAKSKLTPRTL